MLENGEQMEQMTIDEWKATNAEIADKPPFFPLPHIAAGEPLKSGALRGCALLLGGFDGLHKGHETLLLEAKQTGLPVVAITIEGGKGEPLFTGEERDEIFFENGARAVYHLNFNEIKDCTAAEFAQNVKREIAPSVCYCGEDFHFGAGGNGAAADFEKLSGISTKILPLVSDEKTGKKIGTQHIKELLSVGDVEGANALLCGGFFLKGTVVKDRGIGALIGFPTANIFYPFGKFRLKNAVYETRAKIDGKEYKGITNFGARPTFYNNMVVTETHFLGFSGDLYGRTLSIQFVRFLREIKAFSSAENLSVQLEFDKRRVQNGD